MEVIKLNKFIAIYARVSTARQEEEGTIATQISAVKDFASKNGFTIVKEYMDDGWSGDILARPALDQLRMDAKKKIWDAVLFYDPDRLARRYSYQELVMDELRELGVDPLFVTIPPSKNSEDKLMYGVRGVFAEYERVKIAERCRLGKIRKANEGHIIVTEAPYGYDFVTRTSERQGYLKVNEIEAKVVRDIYSWVANEKLTLRFIVRRLLEQGIKPRKSKRGVWNTSTLSTLLRNKTYIGQAHYGASYAVVPTNPLKREGYKKIKKTSRKMKPEEEWIIIKTPEILEKDLFEKVQQQLKNNFEQCSRNIKNKYLFAGKIWCTCGERRAGEGPMHGKHLYYRCTNRVKHYPLPRTCLRGGFSARITDEMIWKKAVVILKTPALLEKYAKQYLSEHKISGNAIDYNQKIDIESARKELAKIKDKEDRYAKGYGEGVFSIDQYKKYVDPIRQEVALLESQIAKAQIVAECSNKPLLPAKEQIIALAKKAGRALQGGLNYEGKKRIVKDIISNVTGDHFGLSITGFVPINYFNYVEFKSYDRNCWFAKRGQINII